MEMIEYSVPADFTNETILRYDDLNHSYSNCRVTETYGQISMGQPIGSGRANDLLPEVDDSLLGAYIEQSKRYNIHFNYTLNTTCLGNMEFHDEGRDIIYDFLKRLKKLGVTRLTVAMPSLIEFIKLSGLGFEIKASTVCMINNPNKAMLFENLGVKRMVLDESINRSFDILADIRNSISIPVELIVNVVCHQDCVYEWYHHNQKSHDFNSNKDTRSATYYSHRCIMRRLETAESILKLGWIRPEDIPYYTRLGIRHFKIQGRQAVTHGDPVKAVQAYMDQRYEGNFMDLLDMFSPTNSFRICIDNSSLDGFIQPFVDKPGFCHRNCGKCGYCKGYMERKMDTKAIRIMNDKALHFYNEYDEFINAAKKYVSDEEKESAVLGDFSFLA